MPISHFTPSPPSGRGGGEAGRIRPSARAERGSAPATGSIREYSYWLLLFALVPLMFSLLGSESPSSISERLEATIKAATPEEAQKIKAVLMEGEELTLTELLEAMPGGKFAGAHLPRSTMVHWVYAGVAAAGFLLLLLLMFSVERSQPLHLLGVGLFTGTVGILFLMAMQFCAQLRMRTIRVGKGGVLLLLLMFIGWSYRSALDPDSVFLVSAIGFTFGVGLCEELTKAIPLLFFLKLEAPMGWRGACLWGLASGIGFGVSEGIMYSADSYNGISGPGIYVVRFISCVALHAMWSASVGITLMRKGGLPEGVENAAGFGFFVLRVLAVPMVLHGFYDTLLKTDRNVWALMVALASFAWFALQIERARGEMPEAGLGGTRRRFA